MQISGAVRMRPALPPAAQLDAALPDEDDPTF